METTITAATANTFTMATVYNNTFVLRCVVCRAIARSNDRACQQNG